MPTIQTSHGPIAVHDSGTGEPIVLLHANPGSAHDFDAVISALSATNRVLALDFPGYGDSPAPADPRTASAMMFADVAQEAVEALALGPAVIIGNSVGGFSAARLAARRPDRVRAIILVDSGGFTKPNLQARLFCSFKGSERVTRRITGRFARTYLKRRNEWTKAILDRTDAGARNPTTVAIDAALWRSFASPGHDLTTEAANIRCPALLVWGKHDPVLKLKTDGRAAEALIPGARLVAMDTGHMPFAEDPDAFLAAVQPFLQEVTNAANGVASHG